MADTHFIIGGDEINLSHWTQTWNCHRDLFQLRSYLKWWMQAVSEVVEFCSPCDAGFSGSATLIKWWQYILWTIKWMWTTSLIYPTCFNGILVQGRWDSLCSSFSDAAHSSLQPSNSLSLSYWIAVFRETICFCPYCIKVTSVGLIILFKFCYLFLKDF